MSIPPKLKRIIHRSIAGFVITLAALCLLAGLLYRYQFGSQKLSLSKVVEYTTRPNPTDKIPNSEGTSAIVTEHFDETMMDGCEGYVFDDGIRVNVACPQAPYLGKTPDDNLNFRIDKDIEVGDRVVYYITKDKKGSSVRTFGFIRLAEKQKTATPRNLPLSSWPWRQFSCRKL